ncbi:hypothetical protein ACFXHA_26595 [Nocardia sp. NPDC059240]|uniref:hypothetical protein n=1 Tax=Nocardia sp. NPDC059240 TaxID=3346786 RepID=UPI00368F26B4
MLKSFRSGSKDFVFEPWPPAHENRGTRPSPGRGVAEMYAALAMSDDVEYVGRVDARGTEHLAALLESGNRLLILNT